MCSYLLAGAQRTVDFSEPGFASSTWPSLPAHFQGKSARREPLYSLATVPKPGKQRYSGPVFSTTPLGNGQGEF